MSAARLFLCLYLLALSVGSVAIAQVDSTQTDPAQKSSAGQWSSWRNGNDRHGSTLARIAPANQPAWIFRSAAAPQPAWSTAAGRVMESLLLENRIGYDLAIHPIVAEGKVYFGSSVDHQLHCRDLATGQELWSLVVDAPIRLAPSYDAGKLYFGADDGCAYCVDAGSGQLVWRLYAGPADERLLARGEMISRWPVRTGVLVDGGLAYFGAGIFPHDRILIYCVDAQTGAVRWMQDHLSELDAGRTGLSPQGYLLISDQHLFVPSARSLPVAIDKQTGQLLHARSHSWRTTAGGVVGGYRALLLKDQIVASGDHHWLAMDQASGATGYGWFEGRELIVQGDHAFAVTGSELLKMRVEEYAVNSRRRQELRLKHRDLSRSKIAISEKAKQKLQADLRSILDEIESIADVGVPWRVPCEASSSLLATADLIFVGGQGQVTGYANQDGQQQWQASVDGEVTGLIAVEGHLLVSTDQGTIYTFAAPRATDGQTQQTAEWPRATSAAASQPESDDPYAAAAEAILAASGKRRGFCLVLDNQAGRLAEALARRSELKIYAVDRSAEAVALARQRLMDAGLYGHRVTVHHVGQELPYSNYFADLIVSDALLTTGKLPEYQLIGRHLKPSGGMVVIPMTSGARADQSTAPAAQELAASWMNRLALADEVQLQQLPDTLVIKRGALSGAGSWSHLYGTPANTAIGDETRVQSELGVLWYGDPGPGEMVNRHEGAVGPLATGGRLFVQGESTISAYDAYNGTFLWRYENPKAIRTGVFQNQNPGNLAATEDRLFHFVRHECFELDAATGQILRIHRLPPSKDDGRNEWGYLAVSEGHLIGTATLRTEIEERQRRRGRVTEDATDMLFAIELGSGLHAWEYQGSSISHHTVAMGPGRVYFIDSSITSEQREEILAQDKSQLALLTGQERELAEQRAKRADIRRAVALDLQTGQEQWSNPVDVTDCSDIGIGGGRLTLMYHDGTLLLGGANANGHYWEQFVSGAFNQRRMVALSADHGYQRWAKDANYKGRPIIIGDKVLAEPWSFNLQTGEQFTRVHPTTGQQVPWSLMRTGHHCGILTGCESGLLMFRSGDTAFYDLTEDAGAHHFSGHRLGCWINAIPANGLVMIPEASAGCVCQFSIASTIVLEPRPQQHRWTIHSAVGSLTPVRSMAINLGAPGDRRDSEGAMWLSYPRKNAYKETSLAVDLDLQPVLSEAGLFRSLSESSVISRGPVVNWVAASWAEGLDQLTLPLLGPDDSPAEYQVTLYVSGMPLAESTEATGSEVALNLRVNGQLVTGGTKVPVSAEAQPEVVAVSLQSISVKDSLTLDFSAAPGGVRLHGIEVSRRVD